MMNRLRTGIERVSTKLRRLTRSGHLGQARRSSAQWLEFSDASFTWRGDEQDLSLTIQLGSLTLEGGWATVEMRIFDHGLKIVCIMEGTASDALLYLGNWFIVPPQLRRRGLARAALLACIQTFQHAAFGRAIDTQRVRLEGTFVGDGKAFSRAACNGIQPTNASPEYLDKAWLKLAEESLRMDFPPRRRS
jgi:hypothetical protein